jgi:hypothetical protein
MARTALLIENPPVQTRTGAQDGKIIIRLCPFESAAAFDGKRRVIVRQERIARI